MDLRLNNLSRVSVSASSSFDLNAPLIRCLRPGAIQFRRVRRKVGFTPNCSGSVSASTSGSAANAEKEILERRKGWTDARGIPDERILNRLNQLSVLVSDRVEIHKILAKQRDNWNHLFHSTITIASVSAASVQAMSSQMPAPGLSVVATILNVACAALMALVNAEQPSQLAEEQRRAARFFRRLRVEVEATLKIDPQLRLDASAFWREKIGTLHALDEAFPLPLAPNGLEKFPERVVPAELSPDQIQTGIRNPENQQLKCSCQWTPLTEAYVKQVIARVREEEIPELIELAERTKMLNLWVARVSPLLAAGSALTNVLICTGVLTLSDHVSCVAAAMTVASFISHSISHALQLGSVFEGCRTAAGYYADIQRSAERALELPREGRENRKLFILKLNLELGRKPAEQMVAKDRHHVDRLL